MKIIKLFFVWLFRILGALIICFGLLCLKVYYDNKQEGEKYALLDEFKKNYYSIPFRDLASKTPTSKFYNFSRDGIASCEEKIKIQELDLFSGLVSEIYQKPDRCDEMAIYFHPARFPKTSKFRFFVATQEIFAQTKTR